MGSIKINPAESKDFNRKWRQGTRKGRKEQTLPRKVFSAIFALSLRALRLTAFDLIGARQIGVKLAAISLARLCNHPDPDPRSLARPH